MDEFSEPYRRHWTDYAATFVALAVSVISLWVAIATEKANQKMVDANYRMVAAASWPFLQLESGNNSDDGKHRITLELENAGVGPAKIHSIEIFWRGKAYPSSQALLRACCVSAQKTPWSSGTLPVRDVVLRAGDRRQFLRLDLTPDNKPLWMAFDQVRQNELSYRACYCSVFDECWISTLTTSAVRPVKACPIPATSYYQ